MRLFNEIIAGYRKGSFSERDKGDRFERLMQAYLKTDPKYLVTFQEVWMWNDFHAKSDFGGKDIGIDLVALAYNGEYWAIQCKCYGENSVIDKTEVDSLLSTSGKQFQNKQGQTAGFAKRMWISTTNKWGPTAEETISNQNPPVIRVNLADLQNAPVDWEKLQGGLVGEEARTAKKELRLHQKEARDKTHGHFKENERGRLIMACGTGKTFTSLKIAENETKGNGAVLFLTPSIALLGQTLREWTADAGCPVYPIAICSDAHITKKRSGNGDVGFDSVVDLALPASTDVENIANQFRSHKKRQAKESGMIVVFSTYQSIGAIANAQKKLSNQNLDTAFDLIVCDEAHRTTGVSLTKEDETAFTKVHDNEIIKAKKRLYMTATPRLYDENSKSKAAKNDAAICSMDDEQIYGQEIYRIGFGEAVERGLLADYKVLILTMSDRDVPASVQEMISDKNNEITADDASKLIGCINAMSKKVLGDEGSIKSSDPGPMKRAVAFCQNIKISKRITKTFNGTAELYLDSELVKDRDSMVSVSSKHIDGTMNAPRRDELLEWLKSHDGKAKNECRVLANVKCLSEGVDVPSLDAVLFLSAKNSQVDVVQSVGRVMRKSPGKNYGYIVIPVVAPSGMEPSKVLDDNERFKVVWGVLNALRAHDDRFNATVNKIDLNKKKPDNILVGGASHGEEGGNGDKNGAKDISRQLRLHFQELQGIIYAKMVQKVGDRVYWEKWAKDVAKIAENQVARIAGLVDKNTGRQNDFKDFLDGLRKNINPSISKKEAIEMLSQHLITKPVFEALFEGYSFVEKNAVSRAMQSMLDTLESAGIEKDDNETLDKFYDSVKKRASGIDNAEGKQRIIIELYDRFFKAAFPRMVERLGIVYTPIEVVDFIVHSVNDVLQKEFNRTVSDGNVHILDPFTGTGTFITRLLQSGLIKQGDLEKKYGRELHANEIVLLAYYIAAVNIENAYHDVAGNKEFTPYGGIVLTDTFQLAESGGGDELFSERFPQNSERAQKQKEASIQVIMGNPPYSVGQKSANDNAQNLKYKILDKRIAETYAGRSTATNNNALYDSYVKAFRWATDSLSKEYGGIVAFVTNSGFIRNKSFDGFRKTLENEFSKIYVIDLKGAIRGKSGDMAKKEGGNVFDILTGVAISILVKKKSNGPFEINYYEVDDYLKKPEKLNLLKKLKDTPLKSINWEKIKPDDFGDWLEKRNKIFGDFMPIGDKKGEEQVFFNPFYSNGVKTQRDNWCYNLSPDRLKENVGELLDFYNQQRADFHNADNPGPVNSFLDYDDKKISWSEYLIQGVKKNTNIRFDKNSIVKSCYRPFFKQFLYYNRQLNERVYFIPKIFPNKKTSNRVICVSGVGVAKEFSCIICDIIPDLELIGKSQCFPLYYYEENEPDTLYGPSSESRYIKRDGISDFILGRATKQYGKSVTKEDVFYYVYGFLHSPGYRKIFENDLKKMLPRLPLVDETRDFWAFSKAGRELAGLHIDYENVAPYGGVAVQGENSQDYHVQKMEFGKTSQEIDGKKRTAPDKSVIRYNDQITIKNIPEKAYEYVVNGKPAIEWIMERYQIKTDKKSGITNDPNDWADEANNPRYILDLILSVINVSVQTVDIVNGLPKLDFGQ